MLPFFVITMQFPYLHPRRILKIHKEYPLCIMLLLYALVLMVPLGLFLPFSAPLIIPRPKSVYSVHKK